MMTRKAALERRRDLHMQTGTKRANLDLIIDQLIKDEVVIEKEIKKERGPSTKRLFVKMNAHA